MFLLYDRVFRGIKIKLPVMSDDHIIYKLRIMCYKGCLALTYLHALSFKCEDEASVFVFDRDLIVHLYVCSAYDLKLILS